MQAGELGDPQAGLDGEQEQGVVAAAVPGRAVGAASSASVSARGEVADDGPARAVWAGWPGPG